MLRHADSENGASPGTGTVRTTVTLAAPTKFYLDAYCLRSRRTQGEAFEEAVKEFLAKRGFDKDALRQIPSSLSLKIDVK